MFWQFPNAPLFSVILIWQHCKFAKNDEQLWLMQVNRKTRTYFHPLDTDFWRNATIFSTWLPTAVGLMSDWVRTSVAMFSCSTFSCIATTTDAMKSVMKNSFAGLMRRWNQIYYIHRIKNFIKLLRIESNENVKLSNNIRGKTFTFCVIFQYLRFREIVRFPIENIAIKFKKSLITDISITFVH